MRSGRVESACRTVGRTMRLGGSDHMAKRITTMKLEEAGVYFLGYLHNSRCFSRTSISRDLPFTRKRGGDAGPLSIEIFVIAVRHASRAYRTGEVPVGRMNSKHASDSQS